MKYAVRQTKRYKKSLKKMLRRGDVLVLSLSNTGTHSDLGL
jgi:mRNA-degrading endonuclease YafQ of YafQ-DinJ toxin-antitoxin module